MLFATTKNILVDPWNDDLWDENHLDSPKVFMPPKVDWDHSREMFIEDVDIWEVLVRNSGGYGVYAAWCPYAEFYLILPGWELTKTSGIETYYGPRAQAMVRKRATELGLSLANNKVWVEPDEMWKYVEQRP